MAHETWLGLTKTHPGVSS